MSEKKKLDTKALLEKKSQRKTEATRLPVRT